MKRIKRLIYRIFDRYLRKKAIENHRKMWTWLAEHPFENKLSYLLQHDPNKRMSHNCYLCNYAENKALYENGSRYHSCEECPLDWGSISGCCTDTGSPFIGWAHSINGFRRATMARRIAELPERKDR